MPPSINVDPHLNNKGVITNHVKGVSKNARIGFQSFVFDFQASKHPSDLFL